MKNNRPLRLNSQNGWAGGVCAGLADYLQIDILIVRMVCAIGMLTWWPTILAYIACYFCLSDKNPSIRQFGYNFANTRTARHFRNVDYTKRLYKSSRDKKVAGVCAGIAQYLEISPFIVRVLTLGSLFFGPLAFIAYIVAAVILDREPEIRNFRENHSPGHEQNHRHQSRRAYSGDYADGRGRHSSDTHDSPLYNRDMRACVSRFSDLEKKLRRLEATITSKKFKLHTEMKNL